VESTAGGPADDAGLRGVDPDSGRGGDIIVAIDGQRMDDTDEVAATVAGHRPGDSVEVEYLRGDERRTVTVELTERPSSADAEPADEGDGDGDGEGLIP
jgi:S1-C subfamily serine protease